MFDIKLKLDEFEINSLEKQDIQEVHKWIINEIKLLNYNPVYELDELEFYERFLEYYLNECEFFLKIKKSQKLVGILKGRIEFKNPNEVWINYFIIDNKIRNLGVGSKIIKSIVEYLNKDFAILDFFVNLQEENFKTIKFWEKNKFKPIDFSSGLGNEGKVILKKTTNL